MTTPSALDPVILACRDADMAPGCWSCLSWSHVAVTALGETRAECLAELSPKYGTHTASGETCPAMADVGGRE
jgi:hypothetical protein